MRKSTRTLVALSVTAQILAACTTTGDAASQTTETPPPAAPAATAAPTTTVPQPDTTGQETTTTSESDEPIILIAGFSFDGPESVPAGTTVLIENRDSAAHTWTSVDDLFDSGSLRRGDTFEFTFDTPGEFQFFCRIHPAMESSITVED